RPGIPDSIIGRFEAKLQRLSPGYAPRSARELVHWVEERLLVPEAEWRELVSAIERDLDTDVGPLLSEAATRLVRVTLGGPAVVAIQALPRLARALERKPAELDPRSAAPGIEVPAIPSLAAKTEGPQADLEQLVAEWSRFFGPYSPARLEVVFGLEPERAEEILKTLAETETVVVDRLRVGDEAPVEMCDAENLERLLRLVRARSRPSFETLPLDELPVFLASHQGVGAGPSEAEDLRRRLDRLLLYPAPAKLWETEILPARLDPYYPEWMDALFQETEIAWQGCGVRRACFLFPADRELLGRLQSKTEKGGSSGDGSREEEATLGELFVDPAGRYGFEELLGDGAESAALAERLWEWAWRGKVSNTTFAALRRGISFGFKVPPEAAPKPASRPGRRRRFDRWQSSRPFAGDWFRMPEIGAPADELEAEELAKERVRVLLDRYGVLFRELLAREAPALRWARIFRSLRLMELSGEVLSGHFFANIPGPQFATRTAVRKLSEGLSQDRVVWMSALDPASPCGLGLDAWKGRFPARTASNHLVFHGSRPVVLSRGGGARLEIEAAADHPDLSRYFEFLKVRLTRRVEAQHAIDVESINGRAAADSAYVEALSTLFAVTREGSSLRLRRRY
ncbi:MAG: ATP-dependent helicase, partial [Acidobacteriota bacterium]|nr:ATP-dependent helicase [Acidobacteriota bacterium]